MVYFKENYNFPRFQEVQHFPGEVQLPSPMETYIELIYYFQGGGGGVWTPCPLSLLDPCDYKEVKVRTGNQESPSTKIF